MWMPLLTWAAALAGCGSPTLQSGQVRAFMDTADAAERKRYAPDVCALQGQDFHEHLIFHGAETSTATEMTLDRKMYCAQEGRFSRIRQYQLVRRSLDIKLADDLRSAGVDAQYSEEMPYYEYPGPSPDFYQRLQIIDTHAHYLVGSEHGRLVFLSAELEATQRLVPRNSVPALPYD
jgi:hypothetical protein